MNIQTKKYLGFFVLMKGGLKTFLSTVRTPEHQRADSWSVLCVFNLRDKLMCVFVYILPPTF